MMTALAGETFIFPGGVQRTGRWQAPATDEMAYRSSRPGATFAFEDAECLAIDDEVWRLSKSAKYAVKDIVPDGSEGLTFVALEPQ